MSKRSKSQLSLQVLKKFRIIYGSIRQQFREVEQNFGVTGSQLWILHEVAKTPCIGVSELANRLSIHQSTCSQLVEKLVSRGLITKERSKEDQRRVGVCLTEGAAKILGNAPGRPKAYCRKHCRNLPESALQALDNSLIQVIEQLRIRDNNYADKPLSDL